MDTTCFGECFLLRVITGRHCFLYKPEVWCNRQVTASFETSILKEVRILYYLHNNIAMLSTPQGPKIKLLLPKCSQ